MILKALLAWAGLQAAPTFQNDLAPSLHSDAFHNALNIKTALLAGHARMVRLSAAGDLAAAAGDRQLGSTIAEKQNEVRSALDDLARRLDRN